MKKNVVIVGAVSASLTALLVVACGGGSSNTTPVVTTDAGKADTSVANVDAAPGVDANVPPTCNGTLCGGTCLDTSVDPAHCGDCTTACVSGQLCSAGMCAATCATGYTTCGATGATPYCANTKTDNANCGSCGKSCATGETCTNSACAVTCTNSTLACPSAIASDGGNAIECIDPKTDNANCGSCGNACASGEACVAGTCTMGCTGVTLACPARSTSAGFDGGADAGALIECVDPKTDNNNCGACGTVCSGGDACLNGTCQASCSGGTTACTSATKIVLDGGVDAAAFDASSAASGAPFTCADLTSDNNNCGGCNLQCSTSTLCSSSSCQGWMPVSAFGSTCTTIAPGHYTPMDIDTNGRIYAVVSCGTTNSVSVATSTDGGYYGTPVAVTTTTALGTLNGASILAGPGGVVHLLISGTSGTFYSRSTDSGATWSTPLQVDAVDHGNGFAQVAAFGTNVVLGGGATNGGTSPWIYSNATSGTGTFVASAHPPTSVNIVANGGIGYTANGALWYGGEKYQLFVQSSSDNGATFGSQFELNGANNADSSWAFGPAAFGVTSYISGPSGFLIDTYQTSAVTNYGTVTGGPLRAVAIDNTGNLYIASIADSATPTTAYVQRALVGSTTANTGAQYTAPSGASLANANANPNIAIRGGQTAYALWTLTTGTATSVRGARTTF